MIEDLQGQFRTYSIVGWFLEKVSSDYQKILGRTYAVTLYMVHKFVFFKILPLQLVPLRKF